MLKLGIMGASGYAGEELIRILLNHPDVQITTLAAKIDKKTKIYNLYPWLKGKLDLECSDITAEEVCKVCDVVFLALPHKVSMECVPVFLKAKKKVIDLSADFRLRDISVYEKWYEVKHTAPEYINKAVYGLPEFYREKIKKASLIANPGCYPTSIILGCAPLIRKNAVETESIVCDSKSGVSGAGRELAQQLMTEEFKNSFKPYKVNEHRHMPEIDQELAVINGSKVEVNFIPHLVPMERGILSTIYLRLKKEISASCHKFLQETLGTMPSDPHYQESKSRGISTKEAIKLYKEFYKKEYFVRVLEEGSYPDTKNVARTNFCDIGIKVFPEKALAIVMTAIDNLVKGASGQAVQNMNIMCGFEEKAGL